MTPFRIGHEHRVEIKSNFHDVLAFNWPEPREQLHIGGWETTRHLVDTLKIPEAQHVLDLCCGEGGTAWWLSSQYKIHVTGVDIVQQAIYRAHYKTGNRLQKAKPFFVVANIFDLPFVTATFDLIYGQDPDGLAHYQRRYAFTECFRVLKPEGHIGFHHWVLHDGTPRKIVDQYEKINEELGCGSMRRLLISDYTEDMRCAGFENIQVKDWSCHYAKHMKAMKVIAEARNPNSLDRWTRLVLDIFEQGHKIGVLITAQKPS